MNCLKCGREIALGQVFCKDCLADMDTHPIKPGTPVVLPSHEPIVTPRRINTRKVPKPEDQISVLRKLLLILGLLLLAVSLAFAITTSVLLDRLEEKDSTAAPGQNYSTEAADTGSE